MPPVDEISTLRNFPATGQTIREYLQIRERQTHPPLDRTDPFVVEAIDDYRATYNHLAQSADDVHEVEGDEGYEGFLGLGNNPIYLLPGDVVGTWYVYSGMAVIIGC